jgi:hypothetical protein
MGLQLFCLCIQLSRVLECLLRCSESEIQKAVDVYLVNAIVWLQMDTAVGFDKGFELEIGLSLIEASKATG